MITQKVDINDSVFGFTHRWIEKFAEKFESVTVICLYKGEFHLSPDIKVLSLGKESGQSRAKYVRNFYKYIWQERKNYDAVFVHMNPVYAVLGGLFWRIYGKKVALWYSHKKGGYLRKLSIFFVDRIFSVADEHFIEHRNNKFRALGHGIDTDYFCCDEHSKGNNPKVILTVGRIAPLKEYDSLIEGIHEFLNRYKFYNFKVKIVGEPQTPQELAYQEGLKKKIENLGMGRYFDFLGPVSNYGIISYLCGADVFLNMQCKGGIGKASLEAMSCGTPTLICTPAVNDFLGDAKEYFYHDGTARDFADKLYKCLNISPSQRIKYSDILRGIVTKHHNLDNLAGKIREEFERI